MSHRRKWRKHFCQVCKYAAIQLSMKKLDPESIPDGLETTGVCLAPSRQTGLPMARMLGPAITEQKCVDFLWVSEPGEPVPDTEKEPC